MQSTLALSRSDLQVFVGEYAGFGRGPTWGEGETARIDESLESGLRLFYNCGYDWSFLEPLAELILDEDATQLDLPDDFNFIVGDVIPTSSEGVPQFRVMVTDAPAVDQQAQNFPSMTGRPQFAAVDMVKGTSANMATKSILRVFPTADQEYTLRVRYTILPNALTKAQPFAYGSAAHAETIKAACKAAYELAFDGGMMNPPSPEFGKFQTMLAQSIEIDRQRKPRAFGLNLDGSDNQQDWRKMRGLGTWTVNGVSPL